jgi:hypothetical protein
MRKYSMHLAPIMERCLHSDDGVNPAHGVLQQIADVCILFLKLTLIGHSLIIAAAALLRIRTNILLFCGCMAVFPAWRPCSNNTAAVLPMQFPAGTGVSVFPIQISAGIGVSVFPIQISAGTGVSVFPAQTLAGTGVSVFPAFLRRLLRSRTG